MKKKKKHHTLLVCADLVFPQKALTALEAYLTTPNAELQLTDMFDVYPLINASLRVQGGIFL